MKIGTLVEVMRRTHTGTEVIVGHVISPLVIEEETVTHVTVEGMVVATQVEGLPLPIEEERPIVLEMVPVESRHPELLSIKVLEEEP
jgi:hypothetical protein